MSVPLSARIRSDLEAGRSKEDVVRDLVAEGLSQKAAEHFVEQELAGAYRPAFSEAETQDETARATADAGGRRALVSGALWFSVGTTVTGLTYLLGSPGQQYVIAYGAVLAGLAAFGRGVHRWWQSSQPFPWIAVIVTLAAPPAATSALVGAIWWNQQASTESRRAEEEKRLDVARAVQEQARADAERKAQDEARSRRHHARVARARERLQNVSSPTTLCDAALDLGNFGTREAIPDLTALLQRTTEHVSVRNCAAAALVKLGETEQPLAFYLECARAWTSDCRRIAMGGFRDIGPPAAEAALPYVGEALRSSDWGLRYVAVEALAKLGPLAEPLLQEATSDSNEHVRQHAEQALASVRQ